MHDMRYGFHQGYMVLSTRSREAEEKVRRLFEKKKPFKFLGSEWFVVSFSTEIRPDGFVLTAHCNEIYRVQEPKSLCG